MAKMNAPFVVFNGGEIGEETLDRVTLENYAATAELLENMWTDSNGPMCLRPGFEHRSRIGTQRTRIFPFVRSLEEKFLLCLSNDQLRIAYDGEILARQLVTSTVADGALNALTGWTNISESGSTATIVSGRLALNSNGAGRAGIRQQVTTADPGELHALEIFVHHGPVTFRCGSTSGGDDYIEARELRTGHHSLAFFPVGSYWVEFTSRLPRQIEVESIQVAGNGDLVLQTPWGEGDLPSLRIEQSLNVCYVANGLVRQRRIERWDNNSWSLVETMELDGPFMEPNTDTTLTLTPSVRTGNGTMTASRAFFRPEHVGALFRLTQSGQFQLRTITGEDQWSDPVLVQGVGGSRAVSFTVGTGLTATVRIQQSIGNDSSWADANTSSTTSGGVTIVTTGSGAAQAFNDGLDNNTVYYRVGVKVGGYTSGSGPVTIFYPFATSEGVVRVTNYSSSTVVSMEVLKILARTTATERWEEGSWSTYRGWPRAMTIFDGRLWGLRDDKFWGSYSEAYESHDYDEGNSSAIARSVAVGQANSGHWMMPLGRLIIGTEGAEVVVRSNAFDEPLSTTNMTVREMSTFGAGDCQPIKVDTRCLYVDSSRHHLMEIVYNVQIQDYVARPLTTLHRNVGRPGINQLAVMRRPDTRVFCLKDDGTLLVKLFDPSENVLGWGRIKAEGGNAAIESVAVLPNRLDNQDELYVVVRRTVGDGTYRNIERMGPIYYDDVEDANTLDAYMQYEGAPTTTITNLGHLAAQQVYAWADGALVGPMTVSANTITLPFSASKVCVGFLLTGRYRSSKLAFGAQMGTALAQRGRPAKAAFMLRRCLPGSIEYGQNFDKMQRLSDRDLGDDLDSGPRFRTETTDLLTMPGRINKDPRIALRVTGPGWINGFVLGQEMNERVT